MGKFKRSLLASFTSKKNLGGNETGRCSLRKEITNMASKDPFSGYIYSTHKCKSFDKWNKIQNQSFTMLYNFIKSFFLRRFLTNAQTNLYKHLHYISYLIFIIANYYTVYFISFLDE